MAFIYNTYDNHGIKKYCKGYYQDFDELEILLRGDRHGLEHLETFDLETYAWEKYDWLPLYNYRETWIEGNHHHFLKHRWDEKIPEIEIIWDGPYRKYGKNQIFYEAGEWRKSD